MGSYGDSPADGRRLCGADSHVIYNLLFIETRNTFIEIWCLFKLKLRERLMFLPCIYRRAALPAWGLTAILLRMVVLYAALMLMATGCCLLSAAILWASVRNFVELAVPFNDGMLTTHFGACWYLALIFGECTEKK